MSVEFRQRTPGEYAQIVWRRKWLIILPTIAIATAIGWVVWRQPDLYQSTTLLIVQPATIPNVLVPKLSDVDLTMRINNIGQMVMSRSSLEPIILKYRLYEEERKAGEPMEFIIDRVRGSVYVQIDQSGNVTNAFRISFLDRSPQNAKNVTQELAGKYISGQTEDRMREATGTDAFFQERLLEAKKQLDEVSQLRLDYMKQNMANLPSGTGSLMGQLEGLRGQQAAIITELGRMRERESILDGQLNELLAQSDIERGDLLEQAAGQAMESPAYGHLASRKAEIEARLQSMLVTLKPQNPDVKAVQAELDAVKREMDILVAGGQERVKRLRERIKKAPDPRISGMKINLQLLRNEINRYEKGLGGIEAAVADLSQRLNLVPGVELGLDNLNREYESRKGQYEDLLNKRGIARISNEVQVNAKGEKIQVVDPANMPLKPVAPKRGMLMLMGLALGLAVGFIFAGVFEVPRLLTIQTAGDAQHYTGLPVLASVPELLTAREKRRISVRHALLVAAGIVITIVSIPALAMTLKYTGVIETIIT